MEQAVELYQMLEARERRVHRQQVLIERYALPLVSFSMNIAGPVKNSALIRKGFRLGTQMLKEHLSLSGIAIVHEESLFEVTGCEGLYVVDVEPKTLKKLTCAIEDDAPLGRLYDMDVIAQDGHKLDRSEPRRCLICSRPAQECARSRAHSIDELQSATKALLIRALDDCDAQTAARLATRALLYEVAVTPKPGLVDRENNGSHRDMDIYTFMSSASALWPYFEKCVRIGRETAPRDAPETLQALRFHGMQAECDMRRATGNVNTHKGAIYSMGLLCGALGRLGRQVWKESRCVLNEIAEMTAGTVKKELGGISAEAARTAGQRFYALYGVSGVRGEAEKGFPAVLKHGLPVLEEGLAQGKSEDEAGSAALLAILANTNDTNMIARGGIERQRAATEALSSMLNGNPYPDWSTVEALDREYIRENLSPGGSADLLALCWMLHFLKEAEE